MVVLRGQVARLSTQASHHQAALSDARSQIDGAQGATAPALLEETRALGVVEEELALLGTSRKAELAVTVTANSALRLVPISASSSATFKPGKSAGSTS